MFGRVINKIFKRGTPVTKSPAVGSKPADQGDSPFGRTTIPFNIRQPESPSVKHATKQKGTPVAERAKREWQFKAGQKLDEKQSPEILCGIDKKMPLAEIESKLSTLYRRHNRAASSLDPELREESELMLEAIATLKERYLAKE